MGPLVGATLAALHYKLLISPSEEAEEAKDEILREETTKEAKKTVVAFEMMQECCFQNVFRNAC